MKFFVISMFLFLFSFGILASESSAQMLSSFTVNQVYGTDGDTISVGDDFEFKCSGNLVLFDPEIWYTQIQGISCTAVHSGTDGNGNPISIPINVSSEVVTNSPPTGFRGTDGVCNYNNIQLQGVAPPEEITFIINIKLAFYDHNHSWVRTESRIETLTLKIT